jgi:hypothetical protein
LSAAVGSAQEEAVSCASTEIISEKIVTSIRSSRSGGFSGAAVKAPLHSEDPVQEAAIKRTIEDLELVNEVMPHRHLIMRKRRRKYYK